MTSSQCSLVACGRRGSRERDTHNKAVVAKKAGAARQEASKGSRREEGRNPSSLLKGLTRGMSWFPFWMRMACVTRERGREAGDRDSE